VTVTLRQPGVSDAAPLAALLVTQRSYLAPYEPTRPPHFFTTDGQRDRIRMLVDPVTATRMFLILDDDEIVGTLSLSRIAGWPLSAANVGYWVACDHAGRGIATRAVGLAVDYAFATLGLHRLEAGTLLTNSASQRVLERNGFRVIGLSRGYLEINGRFEDHLLFERVISDPFPLPPLPADPTHLIRPASTRDAAALAALLTDVAGEPNAPLLATGRIRPRDERRRVRQTNRSDDAALLVAERDGELLGRIDIWRDPHPNAHHTAEVGIAVRRDARRLGVASALLTAAAKWSRRAGVTRLEALVFLHNDASLAFFRHHGFIEEGMLRGRYLRDNQPTSTVLLSRAV
jgi:[ribosomal protein S5]-alanine N-acetyltransferase